MAILSGILCVSCCYVDCCSHGDGPPATLTLLDFEATKAARPPAYDGDHLFDGSEVSFLIRAAITGDSWCSDPYEGSGRIQYSLYLGNDILASGDNQQNASRELETKFLFTLPTSHSSMLSDHWNGILPPEHRLEFQLHLTDGLAEVTDTVTIGFWLSNDFYSEKASELLHFAALSNLEFPECISIATPTIISYNDSDDTLAELLGHSDGCKWEIAGNKYENEECRVSHTFDSAGSVDITATVFYAPVYVTATTDVVVQTSCPSDE